MSYNSERQILLTCKLVHIAGKHGGLWAFERPLPGHVYFMAVWQDRQTAIHFARSYELAVDCKGDVFDVAVPHRTVGQRIMALVTEWFQ